MIYGLESNIFSDLIPGDGLAVPSYAAPAYEPVPEGMSAKHLKSYLNMLKKGEENQRKYGNPAPVYAAPAPVYTPLPVVVPEPVVAAPVVAPAPAPIPAPVVVAPGASAAPVDLTPAPPPLPAVTQIVRDTPGYQFQVQQGLDGINANAYARGLGNSGATFKALQEYGRNMADQYYQQYVGNVAAVAEQGRGAAGAIAGAGDQMGAGVAGALNNQAQAQQNAANAAANNAYQRANITANTVGTVAGVLGNIGGTIISSYK